MKYTVVVAEDEELLLNNLVQKIQKADPDFQVTGTAQTAVTRTLRTQRKCSDFLPEAGMRSWIPRW